MAKKLYTEESIADIADAIREKNGEATKYKVAEMGDAVRAIQSGISPGEYEWKQTPAAVQNFIDYVHAHPYPADDYSYSVVQNYAPATPSINNERPIGIFVPTDAGVLEVGAYRKTVSAGNNTIYNVIPHSHTPYSVDVDGTVSDAGTLNPNKPLRQIMTTARNVRDLGGWACDGGTVKYGKLIRGGEVHDTDREVLVNQLGIRHDLNLRGQNESGYTPPTESPLGEDIKFTIAPLYNWYSLVNKESWKINIRCIFEAAKHNEPVYFHCSAGADRTATLACVIEAILGVSQSDIDVDYELTCFYSGSTIGEAGRRRDESDWKGLINAISAFFGSTFRDKAVNFVATLGFTAQEINDFRSAMIDGNPSAVAPSIETYSVTKNLTHATIDNPAAAAQQYQPYEANVEAENGYVIDSVEIKMGGATITTDVFDGVIAPPNGTIEISENGKKNVSEYAFADVNVPIPVVKRLPDAYQEVEWIASNGGQGIDIPISTLTMLFVIADMSFNSTSARTLIGADSGAGMYFGKDASNHYEMGGGVAISVLNATERRQISFTHSDNVGFVYVDGKRMQRSGSASVSSYKLFGVSGYTGAGIKLYSCTMYETGRKMAELVPCYRKSDNVIGLYDLVTTTFYTNTGSGSFTKGADV